jgi:hypothetical protein
MNGPSFQQCQSCNNVTFGLYRDGSDVFYELRRQAVALCKKELSAYLPGNARLVRFAKARG